MKPDSMLVEPEYIVNACQDVAAKGSGQSLTDFAQTEPALASFICESLATVAGKLARPAHRPSLCRVHTKTC